MSKVYSPRRQAAAGFTLIELMMVLLVILLLSALIFKLASVLGGRGTRAAALAQLASLEHALNEYFAEYGIYPPVNTTHYTYEKTSWQSDVMRDPSFTNYVDAFHYGLYAHLYPRRGPAEPNANRPQPQASPGWNPDTERDVKAKARWAHYLDIVRTSGHAIPVSNDIGTVILIYSNGFSTIVDAGRKEYRYESKAPYLSYELWSPTLGK